MGISQEQAKKKAQYLSDGEATEVTRKVKERPSTRNSASKGARDGTESTTYLNCCWQKCQGQDSCVEEGKTCNSCQKIGHFARSNLCSNKKWHNQVTSKNIKTKSDSKAKSVGRMVEKVVVSNF